MQDVLTFEDVSKIISKHNQNSKKVKSEYTIVNSQDDDETKVKADVVSIKTSVESNSESQNSKQLQSIQDEIGNLSFNPDHDEDLIDDNIENLRNEVMHLDI